MDLVSRALAPLVSPGALSALSHAFAAVFSGISTGGHYNPFGLTHGAPDSANRHVGDLGNIVADASGTAVGVFEDTQLALSGDTTVVGRSVVLHEAIDDLGLGSESDSLTTGHTGGDLRAVKLSARILVAL